MERRFSRDVIYMVIMSAAVLVLLFYAGRYTAPDYPEEGTGEYRLAVFGTSDIHGKLVDNAEGSLEYRAAYIADKVNDSRMTEDGIDRDRTVLVDGGDIYQGNAVSNLVHGESMSAVFDSMGYDAVTIGNHEFDWGPENVCDDNKTMRDYTMDGKTCQNDTPVVCSNLYQNGSKVGFAGDYVILDKTAVDASGEELPVRVAVIGFAEDYSGTVAAAKFINLGFSIKEDFDEVDRMASELEESDKCDAVILLAHGNAARIAENLGSESAVDLVIGGHTHRKMSDVTEWGLRYMSPSGSATTYMRSDLVFENDGKGGARKKEGAADNAEIIRLADYRDKLSDKAENKEEIDHEVVDITNEYIKRTDVILRDEIGYVTVPVSRAVAEGTDKRVSNAHNFVTGAMRLAADADVAFINKGGVRSDFGPVPGQEKYTVTLGDIYSMLPFDDRLYIFEITGEELIEVFRYSLDRQGWGLLTSMSGMDCYFIDDPDDKGNSGRKYKNQIPDTLIVDGEVIYSGGKLKEEWKDRKIRLVTVEFSATTNRNKAGMDNPLCEYINSDRLISDDKVLRDAVLEALHREAQENNGYLPVDTDKHFIYDKYDGNQAAE